MEAFSWIMNTYGKEIVCHKIDGTELGKSVAIIQPMSQSDYQYIHGNVNDYDESLFLGLANPDLPMNWADDDNMIDYNNDQYKVLVIRPIIVGGTITHTWMSLKKVSE